jgi:hypothetical protein
MTGILAAGIYRPLAAASVAISDQNISKTRRGTATAGYSIANDGRAKDADGNILEAWLLGFGGSVSNYEVRATAQSGSLSTGTTGSWFACSTTRSWTLSNSNGDNSRITTVILVEIRLVSTGVVQDSATITLNAESVESGGGGGGGML